MDLHKDAEPISKIFREPVQVEIWTQKVDENDPTGEKLVPDQKATGYLHRLTWIEKNHVRASCTQVFKFWMSEGGEKESARGAVESVIPRMTVYFSLRKGKEKNAEKFFTSQESLMDFPNEQAIFEIYGNYVEAFELTGREWGNFLREGKLETLSASPDSTKDNPSSQAELLNRARQS